MLGVGRKSDVRFRHCIVCAVLLVGFFKIRYSLSPFQHRNFEVLGGPEREVVLEQHLPVKIDCRCRNFYFQVQQIGLMAPPI